MKLLQKIRSSVTGRYKRWTIRRIRDGFLYRFKRLTFRPRIIDREIAGERIRFLLGDLFGEAAYGLEHTEWPELDWIKEHCIKPGDVVIDCGANHGFTTILFSKWTGPRGKVHAFEPSSHNMAILQKNLELNSVTNVVCHQAAVGATAGTVSISSHPNASVVLSPGSDPSLEKVPVVKLDDVLEAETPNFVKLDVEGFERQALRGARRLLASTPRLDLELHIASYKDKESELREILDLIPIDRYTVEIQTKPDGPIQSFHQRTHSMTALSRCEVINLLCR